MRIGEGDHRLQRNPQLGRHAAEGQADADHAGVAIDMRIPELVLQDDGHLVRVARQQLLGPLDPGGPGLEGQVEVMCAR